MNRFSRNAISTRSFLSMMTLFAVSSLPSASTKIEGDISRIVFSDSASPYIVTADITVPEGAKVKITRGCVLLFEEQTGLTVQGELEVLGDSSSPVVFSSRKDQAYDTASPQPANPFDWNGIVIEKSAGKVTMRNFRLMYSVFGIKCFNNNLIIENGIFRQNGLSRLTINNKVQAVEENKPVSLVFAPAEPPKSVVRSSFIGSGDATLYIETDPAGATVTIENLTLEKPAPLRIDSIVAGQYTVKAVRDSLIATKTITLESGEVKRVVLTLEKRKTAIRIITEPLDAEIYINRKITIRAKPDFHSPAMLSEVPDKKVLSFRIFKPGYRDTALNLAITPNQLNNVYVELKTADSATANFQKKFLRERKQALYAKYFFIGSAPFFAGAAYAGYMAWKDYNIAHDAKNYLEQTVDRTGPMYNEKLNENRNHISFGNRWRTYAAGAGLLGCAVLGVGFVMYF